MQFEIEKDAIVMNSNSAVQPCVGKSYDFYIASEEIDEKGKGFFTVNSKELGGKGFRFYFEGKHHASPGEFIRLTVSDITPFGWVILSDPSLSISEREIEALPLVDAVSSERENEHLEFKSSLVFTCQAEADIDKQLGCEIMHQIAAFMNADGGSVLVGYRSNGHVRGINKDIPHLNGSKVDSFIYKPSLDAVELKVRNSIVAKLGTYASSLVRIEFYRTENNLLVLNIGINAAQTPIYYMKKYLYVRSGNTCLNLEGEAITNFIIHKISGKNNFMPSNNTMINVIADAALKAEEKNAENIALNKVPSRYVTFYKNGEISTQHEEIINSSVAFSVPFTAAEERDKHCRLLICYADGHTAFFIPSEIFTQKLTCKGKRYMNGFKKNGKVVNVLLCKDNDFLVIKSKLHCNGSECIKAIPVSAHRKYKGTSMHANGHKLVDPKLAVCTEFNSVKAENASNIGNIFLKSGYTAGYPVDGRGKTAAAWLAA